MKKDPIRFEVIRNALLEATEEMAIALRRSAYSTNIKTRADFSCALFDRQLQPVAQAFTQPNHLGSLAEQVPRAVRAYGPENLGPGDALLTNDPYGGGVHLNDITLISPVYYGDAPFGYVANLAHHVDVGGGAPASVGAFREVYQEGIIIPPVKLVRGGEIVSDVFRLVLGQIRSKRETAGDFRAQVAANHTGVRRLTALLDRLGPEEVAFYISELIAYTERRARAEVAKLPKGVFAADGYVDNDGFTDQPVHLVAKVVIDEAGILFDFTGSDAQRRAPVNSTYSMTFSACAFVLKCLMDPDVPANAGSYRLVRMVAPEGTVVNCTSPAPVVGGWETQSRLTDVILKALAPAMPERIPAGTKAMICHVGFGGIDPHTGEYFCFLETVAGGYGGRANSDGPDAVQTHGQNTENAPIEETEINYPVRIVRLELVDDSEGAGRHRGGLGLRRDYLFPDNEASFTVLADRDRWGPWGLFGGLPGRKASYVLNPDREAVELGSKVTLQLRPGDVVSYRTCGGGGYGPPEERDPERVLRDVRDGKVSAARAREVYRVAVDVERWTVDEAETKRLRDVKREA
ncbi:MAG: hydantoinase B/oxoprolinase family protein [Candidatus Latescibacteria bacterium]|nr:hydantoinase B/oxoprolinase family protein [Candidatus Latescibacterota bacterium]